MNYLKKTEEFYSEAANSPKADLCCVSTPPIRLPDLNIPCIMNQMNYGCGTTIQPAELSGNPKILYIGVGGGLEALQFAYFSRQNKGVIAVDPVDKMRDVAADNLKLAANSNEWFDISMVEIIEGNALNLPVLDNSIDIVAQNCLFNIFESQDLSKAISEAYRVLKPGGKLIMSDPITTRNIPDNLTSDAQLRAECLSGAQTYDDYISYLTDAGFGQVEVRAKRPYRVLDVHRYGIEEPIFLESLDTVSIKVTTPEDGPCVFTGKTVTYIGSSDKLDDGKGHTLKPGVPLSVCDKTAKSFSQNFSKQILVTESTWHYMGGGCC